MSDPFFKQVKRNGKGHESSAKKVKTASKPPQKKKQQVDEDILSDAELDGQGNHHDSDDSLVDDETAAKRRLEMAKKYIDDVKEELGYDAADLDKDIIAERMRKDVVEFSGKSTRIIADKYASVSKRAEISHLRSHLLPVTCAVITDDEQFVFSASKDGNIIKWNLETRRKEFVLPKKTPQSDKDSVGHTDHVFGIAVSSDGNLLASAGKDKTVIAWDARTGKHLKTFRQHRDFVSSICFKKNSHQLYSASEDRTIKLFDFDELAYIESLHGHQCGVREVDALYRDRCVSVGGRDRLGGARVWKIQEESQLIFPGGGVSYDCVRYLNDEEFVTGADDGTLSFWNVSKKKPLFSVPVAHGSTKWITALATVPFSDLLASGSYDGIVRLWKLKESKLTPLAELELPGFINSLQFSASGKYLIVGVGQEHRLGRWCRLKEAKNAVYVVKLNPDDDVPKKSAKKSLQ